MIIVYCLAFVIFLMLFLNKYNIFMEKIGCKKKAKGIVTKIEEYTDFLKGKCCWIMFKYTYEGKKYENYIIDIVSKKEANKFSKDKECNILVNPENPDKIRFDRFIVTAEEATIMLFSFVMVAGLGMLIMAFLRKYVLC